jgi:hypothetical protein
MFRSLWKGQIIKERREPKKSPENAGIFAICVAIDRIWIYNKVRRSGKVR